MSANGPIRGAVAPKPWAEPVLVRLSMLPAPEVPFNLPPVEVYKADGVVLIQIFAKCPFSQDSRATHW